MPNVVVSGVATAVVAIALTINKHAVLGVYGSWAMLAGIFQLATGVRRWKVHGAQWPMILSGAQSALAGGFFIVRAGGAQVPTISDIAPYAAFGAFYFLVSALPLAVSSAWSRSPRSSARCSRLSVFLAMAPRGLMEAADPPGECQGGIYAGANSGGLPDAVLVCQSDMLS